MNGISMKQTIMTMVLFLTVTTLKGVALSAQQPMLISTTDRGGVILTITEQVMAKAYQRIGMQLEVRSFPGERAIRSANHGILDGENCTVDGELFRTKDVEQAYHNLVRVPVKIATVEFVVFTKNKLFTVEGWNSLIPYSVVYAKGVKAIEMNLAEGTEAYSVASFKQSFQMLDLGRCDIVIATRFNGLLMLNELKRKDIKILEPPIFTFPVYHYLHVKNQNLVEPLTVALKKMEQEGVIQQIQQQVTLAMMPDYYMQ